jgi:hypothetical protein
MLAYWVSCFQKDTLTGCRQSNCLISSFGGIDKISHSFKMLQDASRCFKMLQVIAKDPAVTAAGQGSPVEVDRHGLSDRGVLKKVWAGIE